MAKSITLELRSEDAEPILREAAYEAAKYSALCDHMTPRTYDAPTWGRLSVAECKKVWHQRFLRAKRIVEAFGVEYEQTSEEETLTVHHRYVTTKSKRRDIGGIIFNESLEGHFDYDNPLPAYRREQHTEACKAAADRVLRRWQNAMSEAIAA